MITSHTNHYIQIISSLHHKKGRLEHNLYLAEGIHLVQEALRAGVRIRNFFWSAKLNSFAEGGMLLQKLQDQTAGFEISEALMAKVAETENPQGILALIEIPGQSGLSMRDWRLGLVLDELQDPGNVGTILRTAWAGGLDGLILTSGTADPFQGKVVRASMGGIFDLPLYRNMEPVQIWEAAQQHSLQIVAGDVRAERSYFDYNFGAPVLILVGNEGRGLSSAWNGLPIERVNIPQPGRAESLNVSVSAALLIYETIRQRMAATVK